MKRILLAIIAFFVLNTLALADPHLVCNPQPRIEGSSAVGFLLHFTDPDGNEYVPPWANEAKIIDGQDWYVCGKENVGDNQVRLYQNILVIAEGGYTVWARAYNGWGHSGPSVPLSFAKALPTAPDTLVLISVP